MNLLNEKYIKLNIIKTKNIININLAKIIPTIIDNAIVSNNLSLLMLFFILIIFVYSCILENLY